jgi:hypothetical protein
MSYSGEQLDAVQLVSAQQLTTFFSSSASYVVPFFDSVSF